MREGEREEEREGEGGGDQRPMKVAASSDEKLSFCEATAEYLPIFTPKLTGVYLISILST